MRRKTTVMAMVARCRVVSLHVLTNDSAVTYAQLFQHSSCVHWQCQYCCSNVIGVLDQLDVWRRCWKVGQIVI